MICGNNTASRTGYLSSMYEFSFLKVCCPFLPAPASSEVTVPTVERARCIGSRGYCSGSHITGARCVDGFCECTKKHYQRYTCLRKFTLFLCIFSILMQSGSEQITLTIQPALLPSPFPRRCCKYSSYCHIWCDLKALLSSHSCAYFLARRCFHLKNY